MVEKNDERAIENESEYDRENELIAFDETKAGVKGLVDAGIEKVPPIFNCAKFGLNKNPKTDLSQFTIPVIDFEATQTGSTRRHEIAQAVMDACKTWGFFQVTNHAIPTTILDEMILAIRRFHEQDSQVKREYYSRDFGPGKRFAYFSNIDLYQAPATQWRDTVSFNMGDESDPPGQEEVPDVCRDIVIEYSKQVKQLGITIFELIAEAFGLKQSYFEEMECMKHQRIVGHYYPPCPEPELTMGTSSHSDNNFLTILLQDDVGGFQVLHENQWLDVIPLHGALIVNVGDLLQLVSNDALSSVTHRVLSKREGPRISVASFFRAQDMLGNASRTFGPIPELISEENPPVYRNINLKEFMDNFFRKGLDGTSSLTPFRLSCKALKMHV